MVRGEIEMRGKLTITVFSMQITSRGWRRLDLIPLINCGRAMRHQWNNNLSDNMAVRIIGNGGGKKENKKKLTIAVFSMQIVSGEWWWWDLIPPVD